MQVPLSGRCWLRIVATLLVLLAVSSSHADVVVLSGEEPTNERRPGFRIDAFAIDVGAVNLRKGDNGLLLGASIGLGTMFSPWVDFSLGGRYWTADIDRTEFDDTASGSVTNASIHPDLRLHTGTMGRFRPYLVAGPAFQFVSADIPDDTSLEDALGGFRVGMDGGLGVALIGGKVDFRLEGRREFVEDVGNWNLALGFGIWPETRARRAPTLSVAATPAPAPAATFEAPAAPRAAATPPAPSSTKSELEPLVRELIQDNQTLRSELEAMRSEMATRKEAPIPTPAPEPPPVPAPARPAPSGPSLRVSLERAAALSSGTSVEATSLGFRYVLGGPLTFESGSSRLASGAREDLRRLAVALLRFPETEIVVEGHTDSSGSAARNLALSEERALSVRNELVLLGVDPIRISSRGHGSTSPITDNATSEARSRNRRVEVHILESGDDEPGAR
jgi:outer membrane protein OmpA-like peptidoglycan-associated protein